MQGKVKTILFVVLVMLLWLPILQEKTKWFPDAELKGAFIKPTMPGFALDSLKSLEFQKKLEDFENYNFGFRGLTVKIRNSFNYLAFSELSISDNIAGRNNFIFSRGSTERTLGGYYNGREKNYATIDKIKFLQEGTNNHGGHLLVVIPPSKESILPELLPAPYNVPSKESTDYKDFIAGYKQKSIPVLDYVNYFKELKKTSKYPLFTKTGFHWSLYGASLAHDTLISCMENMSGKKYPAYRRIAVEVSDTAREPDNDFEDPLNLLFSLSEPPFYYSKFEILKNKQGETKPKVIVIGDSFFWQLKNQKLMKDLFSEDSKFWYYFATTSFPIGDLPGVPLKDINIMQELQSADFVLLVGNISTMDAFPFGVSNYYYDHVASNEIHQAVYEQIKTNPVLNTNLTEEQIGQHAKQICRDSKRVNLAAGNGKFICAGGEGEDILLANRDAAADWETFTILNLEGDFVAIYSYKNKFFSAELAHKCELTSTRNNIGSWERFQMIKVEDNKVAFKAGNGKYLSLNTETKQICAIANSIGNNEKFIYKPINSR